MISSPICTLLVPTSVFTHYGVAGKTCRVNFLKIYMTIHPFFTSSVHLFSGKYVTEAKNVLYSNGNEVISMLFYEDCDKESKTIKAKAVAISHKSF